MQALRLSSLAECGAYPFIGTMLPSFTALMASGVYKIPKIDVDITVGGLEHAPRPAAAAAPGGPRRRRSSSGRWTRSPRTSRWIRPSCAGPTSSSPRTFPYTTASGATYDIGDYEGALDLALEKAGYEELRAEQRRRRERGDPMALGIGLSTYVEITNGLGEAEFGAVEITGDGGAILRTGSFSARPGPRDDVRDDRRPSGSGMPIEKIAVLKGDTDEVARGTGTYGSKSTQIGGAAADKAVGRGRRARRKRDRRRPDRGQPGRHRARHGRGAVRRRRHARQSA